MKRLDNLQMLRGLAALLVCGFHGREVLNSSNYKFGSLFYSGYLGVPVFFIISGFIMVYTTKSYKRYTLASIQPFLVKRFIRVIPLYYVLTFVWILINHQFHYFTYDIFILVKTFLFSLPQPPLYVGWTLNYEMFFYLIFGVTLLFNRSREYVLFTIYAVILIGIPYLIGPGMSFLVQPDYTIPNSYYKFITNPIQYFF